MTIEKVMFLIKEAIDAFFSMFDVCVISVNGAFDITLSELVIGSIIAVFIIKIAVAFSFRN